MLDVTNINEPCHEYHGKTMFNFIDTHREEQSIPTSLLSNYVTELNYNYQTPLMLAIMLGNIEFVKQLCVYDCGVVDEFNKCALDYAKELNNDVIVEILSEYEYT